MQGFIYIPRSRNYRAGVSDFPAGCAVNSWIVGMWAAVFGSVLPSQPDLWMSKQTQRHPEKAGLWARPAGGSRIKAPCGKGGISRPSPPGPPGRGTSDLQDSASSWETGRLRLTGTGVTGNERGMTFLRNSAEGFHTFKHQQLHRC